MSLQNKKFQVCLDATPSMQTACEQLNEIGISFFERTTIDANGAFSMITSNYKDSERVFNDIEPSELNFDFSKLSSTRYIYADDLIKTIPKEDRLKAIEKLKITRNDFDIRNLFQIISIQNNRYETFVFGTSSVNEIDKSEYLSQLHTLENFILRFKSSHAQLITNIDNNVVKLNDYKPNLDECITSDPINPIEKILTIPLLNRYYFNHRDHTKYLTKREYQVFSLLFCGYKHKEVATLLSISPRTVDALISACLRRNDIFSVGKMHSLIMSSELRHCFLTQY